MSKNPNAQALGSLGGLARAKSLSPERRSEIARNAVKAREAKKLSTAKDVTLPEKKLS